MLRAATAVSQMIRDAAAGRVGPVTRIGMGTYVEERVRIGSRVSGCIFADLPLVNMS